MSASKNRLLLRHFMGFFEPRQWPAWHLTADKARWFLQYQARGRSSLSPAQFSAIEPLVWCQKQKEITLQQLVSEMAEWWSNHWGWGYPIEAMRKTSKEPLLREALDRIRQRIESSCFVDFLMAYPGLSESAKQRYLTQFLA
jgi:hypothetical protein